MSTAKQGAAKQGAEAKKAAHAQRSTGRKKGQAGGKGAFDPAAPPGADSAAVASHRAGPSSESPFPPIADYGFISDCHTCALIASDGSIEWMCLPHFDSPSVFGAMLDRGAGTFRVGPYGLYVPAGRRYLPGTNVIETTWMAAKGWLRVLDLLTFEPWRADKHGASHTRPPTDYDAEHVLLRIIECVEGDVQVEIVCEPMLDYGANAATWTVADLGAADGAHGETGGETGGSSAPRDLAAARAGVAGSDAPAADDHASGRQVYALDASDTQFSFRLLSDMRLGVEGNRAHARHTLHDGERCYCALTWAEGKRGPLNVKEAAARLQVTERFWRSWLAEGSYPDHPWRYHLQRSALTLKGLTFAPTGALLAAATTSLPETPKGARNWDYRYCWMRDATFTLWGLHALGLDWEADDFVEYLADLKRNEDGSLQIMYGIEGERDLAESTVEHLKGYEGARPVRVGNGAYNQRQNDVYGAVLDSVYLHSKRRDHIPERLWPLLYDQVRCAEKVWQKPDQGIWEARGKPRHYVSSKLMCWVALDRGARLAERRGDDELASSWQASSETIQADILEHGVSKDGVFRQHYETDALDASSLLVPLTRFLPPDDQRVRATVLAIRDRLTESGLVLRYRTGETDDGQEGEEGTFLICSFWLVSALSEIGQSRQAEHLCERLLAYASPLHLYGEELEASSGRHLGNYPQAFTHLALINAVTHVVEAQQG